MNTNNRKIFIDASLFMGMHSSDDKKRNQSLSIMSEQFPKCIYMNLEQVGMCDEYVWRYTRNIQDDYYPFMDVLHSEMDINRIGYCSNDIIRFNKDKRLSDKSISIQSALLVAQTINNNAVLYTHDKSILSLDYFREYLGFVPNEQCINQKRNDRFSPKLDRLYENSRSLIFPF
ncbi:hypothetical protein A9Q81_17580 [Gammaproteobacteria bacterium 42_54_T18]|nr:hypothetical protein A9Q81_17580 [Gammaproteobacteria bacterium 42_54_T18]